MGHESLVGGIEPKVEAQGFNPEAFAQELRESLATATPEQKIDPSLSEGCIHVAVDMLLKYPDQEKEIYKVIDTFVPQWFLTGRSLLGWGVERHEFDATVPDLKISFYQKVLSAVLEKSRKPVSHQREATSTAVQEIIS